MGAKALLWQLFYFAEAAVLSQKLLSDKITHLHNHFGDSSASVAMLTSGLSGIPFSYTLHGPAELFEAKHWRLDEKTANAKFVACISHFCRSQAMYFSNPEHWGKLRIIHCGVTPELYNPKAEQNDAEGTHFVFVGRLSAVKGLRVLLKAFKTLRDTHPNVYMTVVGDGVDRAYLEMAAQPFGDAIRFTGYQTQTEVAEHLAKADVFVLPSFAEGVPVVLMEAMACAKPVIATQVAGIPELVEDGINGYLVAPGDADALAERMANLSEDTDLRARLGAAGRAKVIDEFDISKEASRLYALFSDQAGDDIRPTLPEV